MGQKFIRNKYHEAIFKWYVLKERNLIHPSLTPYLSEETLNLICQVLNEGSLHIESMTVKSWYEYLLEVNVMHSGEPGAGSRELVPCQVERLLFMENSS